MEDKLNKIIANALLVDKSNLRDKLQEIIKQFKTTLEINKDLIIQTNKIDQENNNGFSLDFKIIELIFKNVLDDNIWYGDITLLQKDDGKKLIYGRQIMDVGNVLVINDGNPYVIIEMILRNLKAGNTTIICNSGFMYGTNNLIIELMQSLLEQMEIPKYLIQIFITEEYAKVLNNSANIDLVVCIGKQMLQRLVLSKSKNPTIISGYENYDLYIDDENHLDLIESIHNSGVNLQIYVKQGITLKLPDTITVSDIDEAIGQINYTGSRYSTGIFTQNAENAAKFIREVKTQMVTVNASPTIERIMDIRQKDLIMEKTIIYPLTFKLDGTSDKVNLESI